MMNKFTKYTLTADGRVFYEGGRAIGASIDDKIIFDTGTAASVKPYPMYPPKDTVYIESATRTTPGLWLQPHAISHVLMPVSSSQGVAYNVGFKGESGLDTNDSKILDILKGTGMNLLNVTLHPDHSPKDEGERDAWINVDCISYFSLNTEGPIDISSDEHAYRVTNPLDDVKSQLGGVIGGWVTIEACCNNDKSKWEPILINPAKVGLLFTTGDAEHPATEVHFLGKDSVVLVKGTGEEIAQILGRL